LTTAEATGIMATYLLSYISILEPWRVSRQLPTGNKQPFNKFKQTKLNFLCYFFCTFSVFLSYSSPCKAFKLLQIVRFTIYPTAHRGMNFGQKYLSRNEGKYVTKLEYVQYTVGLRSFVPRFTPWTLLYIYVLDRT